MKQILILFFLIFTTAINAQFNIDEGELNIEEVNGVTHVWIEGAKAPNVERWQEIWFMCHETKEEQMFKVGMGERVSVKIGEGLVVVGAGTKFKHSGVTYSMFCPTVCITGSSDVSCFEEYVEPIVPPTPPPTEFWHNQYGNQLQIFSELGFEVIFFDINGIILFYKEYPAGEVWVDVPPMADFCSMIYKTHTGYEILGISL